MAGHEQGDADPPASLALLPLVLFRPLTLRERLNAAGVTAPRQRMDALVSAKSPASHRAFGRRIAVALLFWIPLLTIFSAALLEADGVHLRLPTVLLTTGMSVTAGLMMALVSDAILGLLIATTGSFIGVVSIGMFLGGALGPRSEPRAWVIAAGVQGLMAGLTLGSLYAARWGRLMSVPRLQIATVLLVLTWLFFWSHGPAAFGSPAARAASALVTLLLGTTRLLFFPVEAVWQILLVMTQEASGRTTLGASPIFWQEISYLPHPMLRRHIASTLRTDPALAEHALIRCLALPAQAGWARDVLTGRTA